MSPWISGWFWDRARQVDDSLVDVGDAPTYDFRGSQTDMKSRVEHYLIEARVALLDASVELFNVAGFTQVDVKLAQAAFRQDVTA